MRRTPGDASRICAPEKAQIRQDREPAALYRCASRPGGQILTTTMIRGAFAGLMALTAACADPAPSRAQQVAPDDDPSSFSTPTRQWALPATLSEVSGLALAPDGRLFAHDDERAMIYELDTAQGRVISHFSVGAPEAGDFEGLAIAPDGAFWLVTSTGALLRFRAGQNGARVAFEWFDSSLRDTCEIEGLAFATADNSLILACKRNHRRGVRDALLLYAWRPGEQARLWRELDASDVADAAGVEDFRPSSVEIDARAGDVWLLSAKDAAVAQVGEDGALRGAWALGSDHVQAEGLTLLPNGAIVIADEGAGGRALMSVYERDHD
jgi:uncharacterized protein YjiK